VLFAEYPARHRESNSILVPRDIDLMRVADINSFDAVFRTDAGYNLDSRTNVARALIMPDQHWHTAFQLATSGVRFVTTKILLSTLEKRLPRYIRTGLIEEWKGGNWVSLTRGECPKTEIRLDDLKRGNYAAGERRSIIAEWFLSDEQSPPEMTPISHAWEKLIKLPVIPYDMRTRKQGLSTAFEALRELIDAHESVCKEREKTRKKK